MIVNNHAVLILTVKGELRMGLIDLFQKTRETSMEMKPQEDEAAKVDNLQGLRRRTEGVCLRQESVCVPALRTIRTTARAHAHPSDRG